MAVLPPAHHIVALVVAGHCIGFVRFVGLVEQTLDVSNSLVLVHHAPHLVCYAPGLILCATRLSVLIFCYIRLASRLYVPPDRLAAHTGHFRYLDT